MPVFSSVLGLSTPHLERKKKKGASGVFLGLLSRILVYFRAPCDFKGTSSIVLCVMLHFLTRLQEGELDRAV